MNDLSKIAMLSDQIREMSLELCFIRYHNWIVDIDWRSTGPLPKYVGLKCSRCKARAKV
jgi:hypothetical protein